MDVLGRYYTQELYSNLLIQQIECINPVNVLDLGVGGGALIKAASNRWRDAIYYAADIDKTSIKRINKELPFVKIINANSLQSNISRKLELSVGSVDVAICNPPYLVIKEKEKYDNLFREAQLSNCKNLLKLTSDVVFLAQNLRLLQKFGELGIILPDGIITGHEFANLRRSLIDKHCVKAVIELPDKIFPKTEAKTHILIIQKGRPTKSKVPLYLANSLGQCEEKIDISSDLLLHRMDYSYHRWNTSLSGKPETRTLNELGCKISRGKYTHAELRQNEEIFVHTTNFFHGKAKSFKNPNRYFPPELYAKKGTVLLARVGRGCMGKAMYVASGQILFSDCLYSIEVPDVYRQRVWAAIISERGQKWLKANSHGVCATVLSKTDLLNFPVEM